MNGDALVYRVRGRRPRMYPQSIAAAEPLFGADLCEVMIGHLLREAPDGLVIACSNGKWYETKRQALVEITAANPGRIVVDKGEPRPPLDARLWWRDIIQELRVHP
jgi:hypothetical protein